MDDLSEQLRRGFDTVGTTLDSVTAHVVSHLIDGDTKDIKTREGVRALSEALKAQKGRDGNDDDDDALSNRIAKIIEFTDDLVESKPAGKIASVVAHAAQERCGAFDKYGECCPRKKACLFLPTEGTQLPSSKV